jgi:hypothetical protein
MEGMGIRPKGPLPACWEPKTERGRAVLDDARDRYQQHFDEDTLQRGPRGIFYDLRPGGFGRGITYLKRPDDPAGWWDPSAAERYDMATRVGRTAAARAGRFGPNEAGVAYVQDIVVQARRAGLIPEEWVADTRAPEPVLPELGAQSAQEFADDLGDWLAHADITLHRQGGQDDYLELWCEADGLIGRLARTARDAYHVPVYSGGGFDGLKGKRNAAERIAQRARQGVRTVILLIGDYDQHGELIRDVYEEDVGAWVTEHHALDLDVVEFRTLALTESQAIEHDLLDADGKAEAEGIPVPVLDALVRDAIEDRQLPTRREAVAVAEAEENRLLPECIADAVATWRGERDEDDW